MTISGTGVEGENLTTAEWCWVLLADSSRPREEDPAETDNTRAEEGRSALVVKDEMRGAGEMQSTRVCHLAAPENTDRSLWMLGALPRWQAALRGAAQERSMLARR